MPMLTPGSALHRMRCRHWARVSQGRLTSDDYGDKSDPDYQVKFMNRVAYPGLDLSDLQVKG
jgi:hypothetical protein